MSNEETRIRQLEETIAHQGRIIEELSAELAKLWRVHEGEKRRLDAMGNRIGELEEAAASGHEITRPPHY